MDPVQKSWMYQNWIADQNDDAELAKNLAYLVGSFFNPEAVKQLMGQNNVFESSEEDLEETSRIVRENTLKDLNSKMSKRRRRFKG